MERPKAVITGVGAYCPDYILTNEELSRMVDTTDEWIMTRIGIKERRILRDKDKGSAYLGAKAVEDLFARRDLHLKRSTFYLLYRYGGYAFSGQWKCNFRYGRNKKGTLVLI